MVDLCPVVKWCDIQMVVWKPDWKRPVYGPKCSVFEYLLVVTFDISLFADIIYASLYKIWSKSLWSFMWLGNGLRTFNTLSQVNGLPEFNRITRIASIILGSLGFGFYTAQLNFIVWLFQGVPSRNLSGVAPPSSHDQIGPADHVSNIRPIRYHIPINESSLHLKYRLLRQETETFNHNFWAKHNKEFAEVNIQFDNYSLFSVRSHSKLVP